MRKVIVGRSVDVNHIASFGILPLLQSVGWDNILHWGGAAYRSIAQSIFAYISDFSLENLSFKID
ncbi:hypothetical protein PJI17_31705, partial [Mycobacterium kansasii]